MNYGDTFTYSGIEWIYLDDVDGGILAITKYKFCERKFSSNGRENFAESDVRRFLNEDFLENELNADDLLLINTDLTADNGDRTHGSVSGYVSLITCEQIRKYRDVMPDYNIWMWTATPWNVGEGYTMLYRRKSGALNFNYASNTFGVAPLVLFKKSAIRPDRDDPTGF